MANLFLVCPLESLQFNIIFLLQSDTFLYSVFISLITKISLSFLETLRQLELNKLKFYTGGLRKRCLPLKLFAYFPPQASI